MDELVKKVHCIIYLSSFLLSNKVINNPNIYPYNVFADKTEKVLLFQPITVLYGNNASGKSTFFLGTLNAKIYNLDSKGLDAVKWTNLENVRYFYDFFNKYKNEFDDNKI